MDERWKSDIEGWLARFLGALRHKVRARPPIQEPCSRREVVIGGEGAGGGAR